MKVGELLGKLSDC